LTSKEIAESAKRVLLKRAETTLYLLGTDSDAENVIRMEVPHIWTKEEEAKESYERGREGMDRVYALATILGLGHMDRIVMKSVILSGAFNPGDCVFIAKIREDRSGAAEPHPFDLLPGPILYGDLEAAAKTCLDHGSGGKVANVKVMDEGEEPSDSDLLDDVKDGKSKGGKGQRIDFDWNENTTVAKFEYGNYRYQIDHTHLE
jgi:hypothetical protein